MPLPCLRRATPGPRERKVARLSFASEERNSRDFFLDHPLLFVSGGGYHPLISPRASETPPPPPETFPHHPRVIVSGRGSHAFASPRKSETSRSRHFSPPHFSLISGGGLQALPSPRKSETSPRDFFPHHPRLSTLLSCPWRMLACLSLASGERNLALGNERSHAFSSPRKSRTSPGELFLIHGPSNPLCPEKARTFTILLERVKPTLETFFSTTLVSLSQDEARSTLPATPEGQQKGWETCFLASLLRPIVGEVRSSVCYCSLRWPIDSF